MSLRPYYIKSSIQPDSIQPNPVRSYGVSYFTSTQIASIYNFPTPNLSTKKVIGVLSFGGGLYGTCVAANSTLTGGAQGGIVTSGDCQTHWANLGISPANFPKVIIVPILGATNTPSDEGTVENALDVETIGAMYPSSNLTIILYIAPNTLYNFINLLTAATTPLIIGGESYLPSVISISWGLAEIYYGATLLNDINSQLQAISESGVTVTAATGDNGSRDNTGQPVPVADFPSSSPYVLACGGTTLVCPNYVYDSQTVETVWSNTGGGISIEFSKPSYQSAISGSGRNTPDIALVADPNTGCLYTINGILYVFGGTSIVSPAMAAYIAIVNSSQFITPLLYSFPSSVFHDITVGNNGDYYAGVGFDNCTGWGSIIGTTLASHILGTAVTSVSLSPSTLTVIVGSTQQLTATVLPTIATNKTVSYTSSDETIATVSASGLVTGIASGTVIFTVTTADGGYTATSIGTVVILVTGVTLTPATFTISAGNTYQLTSTVSPANATTKTVSYASSDQTVATVSISGLVTRGTSAGTVTITVTTTDGGFTATSTGTVIILVSGVTLSPSTFTIDTGNTYQLTAVVSPANASNPAITYTSNNSAIASVSSTGLVTRGSLAGSVIITVTTTDQGFIATSTGTIIIYVTGVTIPPTFSVNVRGTYQLVPTVIPSTASNLAVTYASSDPTIATVSATGLVTGISASSSFTITVTTADGGFTATTTGTSIFINVTGISLNISSFSVGVTKTYQLIATVFPTNASNIGVIFSSTDSTIASVDSVSGIVTGIRGGGITIIATTVSGSLTASALVIVPGTPFQPAQLSSTYLQSKICSIAPSPAQFASYPKVAITQSSYIQNLLTTTCATLPDPNTRFPQRFIPPPCIQQALPIAASLAGKSLPSKACLFPIPYGN